MKSIWITSKVKLAIIKILILCVIVVVALGTNLQSRIALADAPIPDPELIGEFNGSVCQSKQYGPISTPAVLGNKIYFAASDVNGIALWSSDGTTSGTHSFYTFPEDTCVIFQGNIISNKMIFVVNDQVYASDGTPEGTKLLVDVTSDYHLETYKGLGYFVHYGSSSDQLWRTDGTTEGTIMIKDLGGYMMDMDAPYIQTLVEGSGGSIWYTNGTSSGTIRLSENETLDRVSYFSISDHETIAFNQILSSTLEVWDTDNTPEGTNKITTFSDQSKHVLGTANGLAFFFLEYPVSEENPTATYSLWQTDGTLDGTVNVDPNFIFGFAEHGYAFNDSLFFIAQTNEEGYLYRTSGKDQGGVVELHASENGTNSTSPWFSSFNGNLYYLDKDGGRETIFSTNGNTAGPFGFAADHFYSSRELAVSRFGFMTFEAYSEDNNWKVYYSDGTEDGTHALFAPDQSIQANKFPGVFAESTTTMFFESGLSTYDENAYRLWASPVQQISQVYLPFIID